MMRFLMASAVAVSVAACAAEAAPLKVGDEASIPYAHSDGILDWKVAEPDALYVQSMMGRWYLVRTTAPCPRLRSASALGFVTSGVDQLDRFSTIIAEGWRCPVASVTLSDPPPPLRKKG
jgi:hypothetical protein